MRDRAESRSRCPITDGEPHSCTSSPIPHVCFLDGLPSNGGTVVPSLAVAGNKIHGVLAWSICGDLQIWDSYKRWPSGLERWTGDRVVLGSNPAAATSLRNFGNSVYPTLPVSFGGDTKRRRSLLSGVYARGSKRSHQSALEMCNCRGVHHSCKNCKNNPECNTQV